MNEVHESHAGTEKKIKLSYNGNRGWLIFWIVFLFPVALVLLFTRGQFNLDGRTYRIKYGGSRGWLCFWVVVCFPIALVLLLLDGVALVTE